MQYKARQKRLENGSYLSLTIWLFHSISSFLNILNCRSVFVHNGSTMLTWRQLAAAAGWVWWRDVVVLEGSWSRVKTTFCLTDLGNLLGEMEKSSFFLKYSPLQWRQFKIVISAVKVYVSFPGIPCLLTRFMKVFPSKCLKTHWKNDPRWWKRYPPCRPGWMWQTHHLVAFGLEEKIHAWTAKMAWGSHLGDVWVSKAGLRLVVGASAADSRLLKFLVEVAVAGKKGRPPQGSELGTKVDLSLEAAVWCLEAAAASASSSAASLPSAWPWCLQAGGPVWVQGWEAVEGRRPVWRGRMESVALRLEASLGPGQPLAEKEAEERVCDGPSYSCPPAGAPSHIQVVKVGSWCPKRRPYWWTWPSEPWRQHSPPDNKHKFNSSSV